MVGGDLEPELERHAAGLGLAQVGAQGLGHGRGHEGASQGLAGLALIAHERHVGGARGLALAPHRRARAPVSLAQTPQPLLAAVIEAGRVGRHRRVAAVERRLAVADRQATVERSGGDVARPRRRHEPVAVHLRGSRLLAAQRLRELAHPFLVERTVGAAEVHVQQASQQRRHLGVRDDDGYEPSSFLDRALHEHGVLVLHPRPLHGGRADHQHPMTRLPQPAVHLVDEHVPGPDLPGVEEDAQAGAPEVLGERVRPFRVGVGVGDEGVVFVVIVGVRGGHNVVLPR